MEYTHVPCSKCKQFDWILKDGNKPEQGSTCRNCGAVQVAYFDPKTKELKVKVI